VEQGPSEMPSAGLPWLSNGWESACSCEELVFEPWSGRGVRVPSGGDLAWKSSLRKKPGEKIHRSDYILGAFLCGAELEASKRRRCLAGGASPGLVKTRSASWSAHLTVSTPQGTAKPPPPKYPFFLPSRSSTEQGKLICFFKISKQRGGRI